MKRQAKRIVKFALCFVTLTFSFQSIADCKLPAPDGEDLGESGMGTPSTANLFGNIERLELPNVFIRNGKTKLLEQISVAKIDVIFSVYGGDEPVQSLKPGLQAWVWFEGCKRPKTGPIYAAYFQIFSTDPNDKARLSREGKIVSVPSN